jgi:hypothetical protein
LLGLPANAAFCMSGMAISDLSKLRRFILFASST